MSPPRPLPCAGRGESSRTRQEMSAGTDVAVGATEGGACASACAPRADDAVGAVHVPWRFASRAQRCHLPWAASAVGDDPVIREPVCRTANGGYGSRHAARPTARATQPASRRASSARMAPRPPLPHAPRATAGVPPEFLRAIWAVPEARRRSRKALGAPQRGTIWGRSRVRALYLCHPSPLHPRKGMTRGGHPPALGTPRTR